MQTGRVYEFYMYTAFRERQVIITNARRLCRQSVSSQNVWNILCPSLNACQTLDCQTTWS